MRCLVFVSRPHTWEPEPSELHVLGAMWLVVCVWWHVVGGLVACGLVPCCRVSFDRNTNTQAHAHTHTHTHTHEKRVV